MCQVTFIVKRHISIVYVCMCMCIDNAIQISVNKYSLERIRRISPHPPPFLPHSTLHATAGIIIWCLRMPEGSEFLFIYVLFFTLFFDLHSTSFLEDKEKEEPKTKNKKQKNMKVHMIKKNCVTEITRVYFITFVCFTSLLID